MKKLILTIVLGMTVGTVFCQIYQIPLRDKIIASDIILEGSVISNRTIEGKDGNLYTLHDIKIKTLYKGVEYTKPNISILTRGGTTEDKIVSWTHLLSLVNGETGIFFLQRKESNLISTDEDSTEIFTVFSSGQGFIKFTDSPRGKIGTCPFQVYEDIDSGLISVVENMCGETKRVFHSEKKVVF